MALSLQPPDPPSAMHNLPRRDALMTHRPWLIGLGLLILSMIVLLIGMRVAPTSLQLSAAGYHKQIELINFHSVEQHDGISYRWSYPDATLRFSGFEGRPILLALSLAAPRSVGDTPVSGRISTNQHEFELVFASDWRTYHVLVPDQPEGSTRVTLSVPEYQAGGRDRRTLGLVLQSLTVALPRTASPAPSGLSLLVMTLLPLTLWFVVWQVKRAEILALLLGGLGLLAITWAAVDPLVRPLLLTATPALVGIGVLSTLALAAIYPLVVTQGQAHSQASSVDARAIWPGLMILLLLAPLIYQWAPILAGLSIVTGIILAAALPRLLMVTAKQLINHQRRPRLSKHTLLWLARLTVRLLQGSVAYPVVALAVLILGFRKFDALANPQFWAEDGTIFFLHQYYMGSSAIFRPYAGYNNLVSRLVAAFADSFFPYHLAPFIYNYASLLIMAVIIWSVFSPRLQTAYKPLIALSIVLVYHPSGEVFLNITNIQWFLALMLIIVLLKEHPHQRYGDMRLQLGIDSFIIILCGLTGPFIIFLAPFFGLKWLFRPKTPYTTGILLLVGTIALRQVYLVLSYRVSLDGSAVAFEFSQYVMTMSYWFGRMLFGQTGIHRLDIFVLTCFYTLTVGSIFIAALWRRSSSVIILLAIHFSVSFAAYYQIGDSAIDLFMHGLSERYLIIPSMMLVWALIFSLNSNTWHNMFITTCLTLMLISSLSDGFQSQPFIDYRWSEYSALIGKEEVIIPINPPDWTFTLQARPE
jgi:hypothetical protein